MPSRFWHPTKKHQQSASERMQKDEDSEELFLEDEDDFAKIICRHCENDPCLRTEIQSTLAGILQQELKHSVIKNICRKKKKVKHVSK